VPNQRWYIPAIVLRMRFPRPLLPCAILLRLFRHFAGTSGKEPAPRFNASTIEGERFSNDSIKGKIVLLKFWTTWRKFCVDEVPICGQARPGAR
jgi:hypothetical protein